jgi:hypothetical protein
MTAGGRSKQQARLTQERAGFSGTALTNTGKKFQQAIDPNSPKPK